MAIELIYIGTATLLLDIDGLRLMTDPVLGDPGRTTVFAPGAKTTHDKAPVLPPEGLGAIDAVLLSHDQHADNLDAEGRALLDTVPAVWTTRAAARRIGGQARGLAAGQSVVFETPNGGPVTVTATVAHHGPAWVRPISGPVIGFHLSCDDGSIWITGDTVLSPQVKRAAKTLPVDMLIPHLGAARLGLTGPVRYTMDAHEGASLARLVGASWVVPVHYEGWTHFSQGRQAIEAEFQANSEASVLWLEAGTATPVLEPTPAEASPSL